jgi:hypothetical protein
MDRLAHWLKEHAQIVMIIVFVVFGLIFSIKGIIALSALSTLFKGVCKWDGLR